MRRILALFFLFAMSLHAGADTLKGYEAYQKEDFKTAVTEFRSAAEAGDPLAQFYLGECYFNGRGVPQDFAGGIEWYTKAAEQGQVEAQETLGGIYFTIALLEPSALVWSLWSAAAQLPLWILWTSLDLSFFSYSKDP